VLFRLLFEEIERHEAVLSGTATPEEQRKAIHALKGSAGLAGQTQLSEALARIERRISAGETDALADARSLLTEAKGALGEGRPAPGSEWPVPPRDLSVRPIDPTIGPRYGTEMVDRLDRIDRALADEIADGVAAAYREVHAMKGAALAVGDELTAWFCHGMEERLRDGEQSAEAAQQALEILARWRGVLGELIVAPEHALEMLRAAAPRRASTHPPGLEQLPPPPRRPFEGMLSDVDVRGDQTLRVPTATLDGLFERVRQLDQTRAPIGDGAVLTHAMAVRARQLRHSLAEALRLIGPPRPWGAPAAALRRIDTAAREMTTIGDALEREARRLKETADEVCVEAAAAHGALAAIRTTKVNYLFDRVAAAVSAQARREGREVRIAISGADTPVDRRIADLLVDPILQLARNAVAHGIEPAAERALRGKPRVGTIRLSAEVRGGGLRLRIQDDGAGVDVADVRGRAIATGTISPEVAAAADDQTLLALLFVPGFTTRDSADLLAGRGVGLDLALEAVRRLGGTIRLMSQRGAGFTATLDLPLERGLVKVLWLEAAGQSYALPVFYTRRIVLGREEAAQRAVRIDACVAGQPRVVRRKTTPPPAFAIELVPVRDDAEPTLVGVDAIGAIEDVALRGISPVVSTAGPYSGAIVRGGELRLCLDAHALADMIALAEDEVVQSV
jgi:two-component system chemotaxis sensor kinase CheA